MKLAKAVLQPALERKSTTTETKQETELTHSEPK